MLQLGEFSAWISVGGAELEPHGIQVSADKTRASCWIVSEVGKPFKVEWSDTVRSTATGGDITIDGVACGGRLIRRADDSKFMTANKSYVRVSETTCRAFTFSSLELTDDDSYVGSSSCHALGEISLSLWRVTIGPAVPPPIYEVPQTQKVHERSKKALAHCVNFGEDLNTKPNIRSWSNKNLSTDPCAVFTFKYRSFDILRANGLIPQPPSAVEKRRATASPEPDVPVKDEDVQGMQEDPDVEEVRLLEERLDAARERLSKKRKTSKKFKVEPDAGSSSSFVPGEVIDLT